MLESGKDVSVYLRAGNDGITRITQDLQEYRTDPLDRKLAWETIKVTFTLYDALTNIYLKKAYQGSLIVGLHDVQHVFGDPYNPVQVLFSSGKG